MPWLQWPAASPWVTAVGGTSGCEEEVASIFSGGGFSNRWARPGWQSDAVAAYLANAPGVPSKGFFNDSGTQLLQEFLCPLAQESDLDQC
eukprot:6406767-Ditylum_brightwellii.AAC.1